MLTHRRTLCIIMGGGRGTRMYPLTQYRSKPAIPLGGRYRLIDVPVSNCLNSGFNKILVLTQYNSESLNKHIFRTYKLDTFFNGFVEILAAEQSHSKEEWFQGTADSVRRSLPHVHDPHIDEVIVLSGDQLYNMDLKDLQAEHHASGADITIACHPEPADSVHHFGIMGMDKDQRITSFIEKPKDASLIKEEPLKIEGKSHYMANMGIYIFKKNVLSQILQDSDKDDFGRGIIPEAIKTKKVHAYSFNGYWSDIGTIASYYDTCLMLTDKQPAFNLYNSGWPIYTRPRFLPPAKINECHMENTIVGEGCIVDQATLIRSVIGVRGRIGKNTRIEECILNGNDYYAADAVLNKTDADAPQLGIGDNCIIEKAIIDKNVSIGDNVRILKDGRKDHADGEGYTIRDGIVVVHKGAVIPSGTTI